MSSSVVWVQLYYNGTDNPEGDPIKVSPVPDDVADLKGIVYPRKSKSLQHCDPDDLILFPPKSSRGKKKYNVGKKLEELVDELKYASTPTSFDSPLVVVAPDPKKQPSGDPGYPFHDNIYPNKPSTRRPPLPPTPETQQQQQQPQQTDPMVTNALQILSISMERKAACRMWTGDPTVYDLKATSYQDFDKAVRAKYAFLDDEENISYYVIKQKRDVSSRAYISNDDELNDFFDLAGKPTIIIWPRGNPSLSPASLPSEIEIHLSSAESVSESSGSSCGYAQTLFRQAVRKRDGNQCVLSGEVLRPKAGNVEAAHIFGIEGSLCSQRDAAGVLNAYDTLNGMLLEKSLHVAFDAYDCCKDEFLVVHVSKEGKWRGLQQWDGKKVRLSVGSPLFPSRELLQARFALYKERQRGDKTSGPAAPRRSGPKSL